MSFFELISEIDWAIAVYHARQRVQRSVIHRGYILPEASLVVHRRVVLGSYWRPEGGLYIGPRCEAELTHLDDHGDQVARLQLAFKIGECASCVQIVVGQLRQGDELGSSGCNHAQNAN